MEPNIEQDNAPWFFATEALNQRQDLIRHLLELGNTIILVVGDAGSGKSRLCQQLAQHGSEHWQTVVLQGEPGLNSQVIPHQLVDMTLGDTVTETTDYQTNLEYLQDYVNVCQADNKQAVLFIDDAHRLPTDSLLLVFALTKIEDQQAAWKVVLFCGPQIHKLLQTPALQSQQHQFKHLIDIPCLTEDEVGAYLTHYQRDLGESAALLREERAIHHVYEQSRGLPGRIPEVVRQLLLHGETQLTPPPSLESSERSRLGQAILQASVKYKTQLLTVAGLLAILTLSILMKNWFGTDDTGTTASAELPLPTVTSTDEPDKPVLPADETATRTEPADTAATLSGGIPPDAPATDLLDEGKAPSSAPAPVPAKPPRTPPGTADDKTPEPTNTGLKDEGWIKNQRPESYVLQLLGTHDKGAAQHFLIQHKLQNKTAWYTTTRAGKPWYVIVYGPFNSKQQAANGVASLPLAVQQLKPWPRTVAGLKGGEKPH